MISLMYVSIGACAEDQAWTTQRNTFYRSNSIDDPTSHSRLNPTQCHRNEHCHIHCPQKSPPFYFWNNSVKNSLILVIFGELNPEKIW